MRRALYAIVFGSAVIPYALIGQELKSVWNGTHVRVSAPSLHFLSGRAMDRLRDGNTVTFDFALTITAAGVPLRRSLERFVFSYDLWEERFSVARLGRDSQQRKQSSQLVLNAAEAWCLENLAVITEGVAPGRNVNIHLEVRAEDPREPSSRTQDPGISLTALVEIFSRPARPQQARWNLQQGPLRLNDIRER